MAIGVQTFTPNTWQQSNPIATGYEQGQDIFAKAIQNYFAPQVNQQDLMQKELANRVQSLQMPFVTPMAQAGLQQAQAIPGLTQAESYLATQEALKQQFLRQYPQYIDYKAFALTNGQGAGGGNGVVGPSSDAGAGNGGVGPSSPNVNSSAQGVSAGGLNASGPIVSSGGSSASGPSSITQAAPQTNVGTTDSQVEVGTATPDLTQPIQQTKYDYGLIPPSQTQQDLMENIRAQIGGRTSPNQAKAAAFNTLYQQQSQAAQNDVNKATAASHDAIMDTMNLNALKGAYEKAGILQTGPVFGHIPAFTPGAQELQQQVVQNAFKTLQTVEGQTHKTDSQLAAAIKTSPNGLLQPEALSDIIARTNAYNQRIQEVAQMQQTFNNMQPKVSQSVRNNLINQYWTLRPPVNSEQWLVNSPYQNTWQDFTKPAAINAAYQGLNYIPPNQQALQSKLITQQKIETLAAKVGQKNPTNPLASPEGMKKYLRDQGGA